MTSEELASIEARLSAGPEAAFMRMRDAALKERDEARRELEESRRIWHEKRDELTAFTEQLVGQNGHLQRLVESAKAREAAIRKIVFEMGGYQQGDNGMVVGRNQLRALNELLETEPDAALRDFRDATRREMYRGPSTAPRRRCHQASRKREGRPRAAR